MTTDGGMRRPAEPPALADDRARHSLHPIRMEHQLRPIASPERERFGRPSPLNVDRNRIERIGHATAGVLIAVNRRSDRDVTLFK